MADKKNAYDGAEGDTGFRRTWDKKEWAAKAATREAKEREERKARAVAKSEGRKYYAPTPDDAVMVEARRERINFEENLNKTTLVPIGAGVGKRGKSAGFYCEHCDLTYKDSLQWVDHLNSKQHLHAVGKMAEVEEATLEEVLQRIQWLKKKKDELEKGEELDLKKRMEERQKVEEEERFRKREKRKEARRRKRVGEVKKEVDEEIEGMKDVEMGAPEEEEDGDAVAMARMMGFSGGFGSTKRNQ